MKRIIRMLVVCALAISMAIACYGDNFDVAQKIDSAAYKQNVSRAYWLYNDLLDSWRDGESDTVNYPDVYGGAYVNDDGNLVILVTEQSYDTFDDVIPIDEVLFENTNVSYSKLLSDKSKVAQAMRDPASDLYGVVTAVAVTSYERSVVAYIDDNGIATHSNDVEITDIIKNITGCECNIIIEHSNDSPTPQNDINALTSSYIVYPGYKIDVNYNGYVSYRSIAFWAYDRYGNLGVVTAPHSTLQVGMPMTYYGKDFGTCTQAVFGGSVDAAFIKMEHSGFTPSLFVTGHGFNIDGNYYIRELPEKTPIYTIGAGSGPQTGEVIRDGYETTYGIKDCIIASNYVFGGDSGGLAVAEVDGKKYIAGIITGANITSTRQVIFAKVGNALNSLGLTIYY